jgi:hypothetical protein
MATAFEFSQAIILKAWTVSMIQFYSLDGGLPVNNPRDLKRVPMDAPAQEQLFIARREEGRRPHLKSQQCSTGKNTGTPGNSPGAFAAQYGVALPIAEKAPPLTACAEAIQC